MLEYFQMLYYYLESIPIPSNGMLSVHQNTETTSQIFQVGGVIAYSPESNFEGPPHYLGNPVTTYSPNHPRAVFLHDLKIGGVQWSCTCDGIGFVEIQRIPLEVIQCFELHLNLDFQLG